MAQSSHKFMQYMPSSNKNLEINFCKYLNESFKRHDDIFPHNDTF